MTDELVSLVLRPSERLPGLEEFKTYLTAEFWRQVPGFKVLEATVDWGDCTIDLLGRDGSGRLIALFVRVSRDSGSFHEVVANALVASTWVEENLAETARLYGDNGVDPDHPLRMIFVTPAPVSLSRVLARTAEKAGVEVLPYTVYELETSEGMVRAVSFAPPGTPALAAGGRADPNEPLKPDATELEIEIRETETPQREAPKLEFAQPGAQPRVEAKPGSPLERFVSSLADPNLKAMSQQILAFLLSRSPTAAGTVISADTLALNAGGQHLSTIHLDRKSGALWLEVGPDRIPTNKIKDPTMLERALKLPSVLSALGDRRAA